MYDLKINLLTINYYRVINIHWWTLCSTLSTSPIFNDPSHLWTSWALTQDIDGGSHGDHAQAHTGLRHCGGNGFPLVQLHAVNLSVVQYLSVYLTPTDKDLLSDNSSSCIVAVCVRSSVILVYVCVLYMCMRTYIDVHMHVHMCMCTCICVHWCIGMWFWGNVHWHNNTV